MKYGCQSERGAAVREQSWGAKFILYLAQSTLNSFTLGRKKARKQRGDVLVPQCLSGAEPVPSRGAIGVCPSLPRKEFLFHGTGEGFVVAVCCPNASDAPACWDWGRCLSKDCGSASQNGDQNGILPLPNLSKHPNTIPQSSVLSHLHLSTSFLFFPYFVPFPWGRSLHIQPPPDAASIPSTGSIPAVVWGTPSRIDH